MAQSSSSSKMRAFCRILFLFWIVSIFITPTIGQKDPPELITSDHPASSSISSESSSPSLPVIMDSSESDQSLSPEPSESFSDATRDLPMQATVDIDEATSDSEASSFSTLDSSSDLDSSSAVSNRIHSLISRAHSLMDKDSEKPTSNSNLLRSSKSFQFRDEDRSSIMNLLTQAALLGSSEAMYELGTLILFADEDHDRNITQSVLYLENAASMGNSDAQHLLAFLYEMYLYSPQSAASSSLEPSLEAPREAEFSAPKTTDNSMLKQKLSNRVSKAVVYDYFAAMGGSIGAKLSLGYRHFYGINVPVSCTSGIRYYKDVASEVIKAQSDTTLLTMGNERVHLSDEYTTALHSLDNRDVIQFYQHSAENGNTDAQLIMGTLLYNGQRGLPQNLPLAARYFKEAAAQSDTTALARLGQMFINNQIQPDNKDIRSFASTMISKQGLSDGLTGFELLLKAAGRNSPLAETIVGQIYLHGEIAPANYRLALKYFGQADQKGSTEATFELGVMHFAGLGIPQDTALAFQYFHSAAVRGHLKALFNVAQMRFIGMGTPATCEIGGSFFKLVAERHENTDFLYSAHDAFAEGKYTLSWLWYALAAYEGNEVGMSNAAYLVHRGYVHLWDKDVLSEFMDVTELNNSSEDAVRQFEYELSYKLYQQSAELGNTASRRQLGDYVWDGYVSPASIEAKTSALDNHHIPNEPQSRTHAFQSVSIDQDSRKEFARYALATKLYLMAGSEGDAESCYNLGYAYEHGYGVTRDLELAKRYYDMAFQRRPDAWLPLTICLWKLRFMRYIEGFSSWFVSPSDPSPQVTDQSLNNHNINTNPPQSSLGENEIQKSASFDTHEVSTILSNITSHLEEIWIAWEWWENFILAVLCCILATLIYLRAQRL